MNGTFSHWTKAAIVMLVGILPATALDCDLYDSALRLNVDRYDDDYCDGGWDCGGYYYEDDYYYDDYYYDDYYYDPWYYSW